MYNITTHTIGPRIIVSPVSQRINYTSPLRMTCIAYLGRETVVDSSSSLSWYTEAREVITNSTQVNVYSTAVVRQGLVFMESILEACAVYSNLVGELSCGVMNGGGEDSARWNITYDVGPPVIVVSKPASQVVNYTSALQMNCTSLVLREESSDSNIAWWVENTQIRNSSETLIYTNRERVGNMVFIRSTLVVSRITYSHLGELSCIAENSLGRDVATWTLTPTVEYPPPIVTTTSGTKLVYFGEPINATCTANVGPIKAYNMYPSMIVWFDTYGQQIRPATNQIYINTSVTIVGGNTILESTLLINRVDVQHVGVLECQVDNLFGIDYATVSVNTYEALRAPRLLLAPVNQTIDCRSRVTLVCVVNAFPLPDIWWTFNDIRVDPGNANILENGVSRFGQNFSESYLDICEFEQPGYFKCSASNSLGNATSNPGQNNTVIQEII